MEVGESVSVDFESEFNNVAYATADGLLRIWEADTSKLKNEYLPSAHLSATCTCLKFRPVRSCSSSKNKKKRSNKSIGEVNNFQDDSEVVAFGSAAGNINLYSVTRGEIQCQLKDGHTSPVADICWSADTISLYSGSTDGLIVHWDTTSAKQLRKWKCGKSGLSTLSLCGDSHLISASRSISIWSLDTLKEVKSFTGHATNILRVHTVRPDESDNPTDVDSIYLVSVAHDDRVISLWTPSAKSGKAKRATASFILENEPQLSTVHYEQGSNCLKLALLTTAGSVEVFEHQLTNAVVKKPLGAVSRVTISTAAGKPIPILACKLTASDRLLLMYGTAVCPVFETLELGFQNEHQITLQREDPSRASAVTRVTSVGNVRQPKIDGDVTTLTPAVEGGKRLSTKKSRGDTKSEKRHLEPPEVTIEEKLALLRGSTGKLPDITGPIDSLATLLSQGLQSDDTSILNKTLQTCDIKIINTTIRRLPLTCVMPLMKHLTTRLEKYGSSSSGQGGVSAHTSLVKWVRALLHIHASYLATFPELMDRLQRMYSIMENRVSQLETFTRLQGRLELMLSQIARQKDDEQGAEASAALLTLQDESSEDEMIDDLDMLQAHSESEDGYLSADEDDLLK